MTGPATVAVYFEGTQEGDANDDDDDQLDDVMMQMTELNLTGFSPLLGPVQVTLNPDIPSMGQIEENDMLDAPACISLQQHAQLLDTGGIGQ